MTAEPDDTDFENWPAGTDPVNTALLPLLEFVFVATADGSRERAAALGEVVAVAERIRAALAPKPRLQ
jgi:hypothetical protein